MDSTRRRRHCDAVLSCSERLRLADPGGILGIVDNLLYSEYSHIRLAAADALASHMDLLSDATVVNALAKSGTDQVQVVRNAGIRGLLAAPLPALLAATLAEGDDCPRNLLLSTLDARVDHNHDSGDHIRVCVDVLVDMLNDHSERARAYARRALLKAPLELLKRPSVAFSKLNRHFFENFADALATCIADLSPRALHSTIRDLRLAEAVSRTFEEVSRQRRLVLTAEEVAAHRLALDDSSV